VRVVISAQPTVDVGAYAKRLAGGQALLLDASPELCRRHGFQTLYEMPTDLQKRVRRRLIKDHAENLRAHDAVVCDHSVFGWLADWMRWLWGATPAAEWEGVLVEARAAVGLSESIIHVISGPAAPYDGYRWLDPRNASQADRLVRGLYADFDVQARVKYVDLSKAVTP
jgi:hypothetical protein